MVDPGDVEGGRRNAHLDRTLSAPHHATAYDDIAYGCWRNGGVTALDVAEDPGALKLISHTNWCPPFAGGTHSALARHDRDLLVVADGGRRRYFDRVAEADAPSSTSAYPARPVTISTVPVPSDEDYKSKGGHFGAT